MISLSNTTGHAIRALVCLAGSENPQSNIREIADCSGVPAAYLAKIMKKLNDAGLVSSKRGIHGGIWLARPPAQINLLDISEAIEGEDFLGKCLLGEEFCSDLQDCPTHTFWVKNRELIRRELEHTKLSELLEFYRNSKSIKLPSISRRDVPNPV